MLADGRCLMVSTAQYPDSSKVATPKVAEFVDPGAEIRHEAGKDAVCESADISALVLPELPAPEMGVVFTNVDRPLTDVHIEVGPWCFHGGPDILYDGSGSLANSVVRKGIGSSSAQPENRIEVAVKAVSLQESDEASIAMIRRECEILAELGNAHPHILPMLACMELTSEYVLMTPFASHGDLSQQIHVGCECLAEVEAHRLTRQLMAALAHLHSRRVIHGDVKPKNVFLTLHQDAFLAQLSDFGLAVRLPEGSASIHFECMQGSHGYVPPEMIARKQLLPASDLWALGVMTFQLLACYDPFYPPSQVFSELEFDESCWGPISTEAQQFVVQLLAKEPEARGTSEALTHKWLATQEADLACAPRDSFAPQPVPNVNFHSLEGAQAAWERLRLEKLAGPALSAGLQEDFYAGA